MFSGEIPNGQALLFAVPLVSESLMLSPKSKNTNFGPVGKGYSCSHFWCILCGYLSIYGALVL